MASVPNWNDGSLDLWTTQGPTAAGSRLLNRGVGSWKPLPRGQQAWINPGNLSLQSWTALSANLHPKQLQLPLWYSGDWPTSPLEKDSHEAKPQEVSRGDTWTQLPTAPEPPVPATPIRYQSQQSMARWSHNKIRWSVQPPEQNPPLWPVRLRHSNRHRNPWLSLESCDHKALRLLSLVVMRRRRIVQKSLPYWTPSVLLVDTWQWNREDMQSLASGIPYTAKLSGSIGGRWCAWSQASFCKTSEQKSWSSPCPCLWRPFCGAKIRTNALWAMSWNCHSYLLGTAQDCRMDWVRTQPGDTTNSNISAPVPASCHPSALGATVSGLFSSIFHGSRKKQPQTAVWKKKFHQLSVNTKRWTHWPTATFPLKL